MEIKKNKKWSFGEMTSNSSNGKTSVTSTSGFIIIVIGCISFLLGIVDRMFIGKNMDIINQAVVFTGIGVTLIGYKNYTGHKVLMAQSNIQTQNNTEEKIENK